MKKLLFFALLVPLVSLVSCAQKKDRLTADTLTITIDPSTAQSVKVGSTLSLNAICRSAKTDNVNVNPVWSVENDLGSFSPAAGRSTVFKGNLIGHGNIYATYGDIQGSVPVDVVSIYSGRDGGGDGGGGGTARLTLFGDTQADTDLTKDGTGAIVIWYFDTNNGAVGGWQCQTFDASGGCVSDPVKSIMTTYRYGGGGSPTPYGGWFVCYSTTTDGTGATKSLAAYTHLVFYVKGVGAFEQFKVGMQSRLRDGSKQRSLDLAVTDYITGGSITNSWRRVAIPFTAFVDENTHLPLNMAYVQQPFVVVFTDAYSLRSTTVYLDYIGFE